MSMYDESNEQYEADMTWDEKLWHDASVYGRAEAFRRNGGGWAAYSELYGEFPEDFEE